ncbi:hypothetical protein BDW22DRAFT_1350505 [Trametopsis cervina]|nr:hypothetical protein BDW22DRAFT_1350505 [Trametopsis cervina]
MGVLGMLTADSTYIDCDQSFGFATPRSITSASSNTEVLTGGKRPINDWIQTQQTTKKIRPHKFKETPALPSGFDWIPRIIVEVAASQSLKDAQEKAESWLQHKTVNVALVIHMQEHVFQGPKDLEGPFSGLNLYDQFQIMPRMQDHLGPYIHYLNEENPGPHDDFLASVYDYSEQYEQFSWTWHGGIKEIDLYIYYKGEKPVVMPLVTVHNSVPSLHLSTLHIPWSKIDPTSLKAAHEERFKINFEGFINYVGRGVHNDAVGRFEYWWLEQMESQE